MLEFLLTDPGEPSTILPGDFFQLDGFDTEFQLNLGPGVRFELPSTMGSVTLGGELGKVAASITFPNTLDLAATDFTLEYSLMLTQTSANAIVNIFTLRNSTGTTSLDNRFNGSGKAQRFGFTNNGSGQPNGWNNYCTSITRDPSVGRLIRVALVKVGTNITVFIDGVKTLLNNGNPDTYTKATMPVVNPLDQLQSMELGPLPGWTALTYKLGPIRLSNYARYTDNYTPVPF